MICVRALVDRAWVLWFCGFGRRSLVCVDPVFFIEGGIAEVLAVREVDVTSKVGAWIEQNEEAALGRLIEWLRMPSVSTDPAYKVEVRRAGEWCAEQLAAAGFEVSLQETGEPAGNGHPIVYARSEGAAGYSGPRILFYGHYDVQPGDPVALWRTKDPFEPVREREPVDRIVARGASDDKGQVHTFLEAMLAWHAATGLAAGGVPMTVMIEGEEESASLNLGRFCEAHREELAACDVCVISDTGMLNRDTPAITTGVRGLAYTEVTLHGPDQDLHSGMWGGRCPNPLNELVRVLSGLWDADRRVMIPGFYEGIPDPSDEERRAWASLGLDPVKQLASIGLPADADVGERGYDWVSRGWARPTADINGIYGGYMGEGATTVISTHATAKVSFRLVSPQDPEKVRDSFFAWLRDRTPAGCRWSFVDHGFGHPATVPADSPHLAVAMEAIRRATGRDAALIRTGGSIPIAGMLKSMLGIDTVFMGFGLDDDRVHSPNEKFEVGCWRWGVRSHAALVEVLRERGGVGG